MRTALPRILATILMLSLAVVLPASLSILTQAPLSAHAATWGETNGYAYSKKISINAGSIDTTLVNYPLRITLTSSNFNFSQVNADLSDIRFLAMDDVTVLNTANISWDGSSRAVLLVSVNITAKANFTDYVTLYWGKPTATANWNTAAVTTAARMVMAWEFSSNTNNGTTIYDSSTSALTVTNNGTSWSMGGRVFDGTNDSLDNLASIDTYAPLTSQYTIEGVITPTQVDSQMAVATHRTSSSNRRMVWIYNGDLIFQTHNGTAATISGTITPGVKTQFTFVSTNNTLSGYINGVPVVRTPSGTTINSYNGFGRNGTTQYYGGTIEEYTVYSYARSTAEAEADYLQSQGLLVYYGDTQLSPSVATQPAVNISMTKDGVTSGNFSGNLSSLGAAPNADISYGYGLTTSYTSNTSLPFDYHISIDSTVHSDYGMTYPMTLEFSIPASANNMTAFRRYSLTDTWVQLSLKTSTDFFNGIEAFRPDYTNDLAYVSASFGALTDDIYLRFYEDGQPVGIGMSFVRIPEFYDSRKAALTVTLDDLGLTYLNDFVADIPYFQSHSIWTTSGLYSSGLTAANWSTIQGIVNGGFVEIAGHSRTHPHTPYADVVSEVDGIRQDIIENLTLPALFTRGSREYVPSWIEPSGDSDAAVRAQLGISKYLIDRRSSTDSQLWSSWDSANGLYNRDLYSIRIGSDGSESEAALDASFDAAYNGNGIYHLQAHPELVDWSLGSYAQNHLDYISGKTDVWYVAYGNMYQYHYAKDFISVVQTSNTGSQSTAIPANLTPGATYHFGITATTVFGTTYGSDDNFTLTMPTVTTGTATKRYQESQSYVRFNGQVSDMGVATGAYVIFNWGYSTSVSSNETYGAITGTGSYSVEAPVESGKEVYYRITTVVGGVASTGSTLSITSSKEIDAFPGTESILDIIPMLLTVACVVGTGYFGYNGVKQRDITMLGLSFVFLAVAFITFGITLSAIGYIIQR